MKIPKNENLCTTYCDANNVALFIMTRDLFGITYFLYEVCGDKIKKLGKANSPTELERNYSVNEIILTNQQRG